MSLYRLKGIDENFISIENFIRRRMEKSSEYRKESPQVQDSRNFYYLMRGKKYFNCIGWTLCSDIESCRVDYDLNKYLDCASIFSEKEEALRLQKIVLNKYKVALELYEVEVNTQVNFKETRYNDELILFVQN